MAGSVVKGGRGKTVSQPDLYIVVIVKKDHLCDAQVILAISSNTDRSRTPFGRPQVQERRERCRWGGGQPSEYMIHTSRSKIDSCSAF